MGVGVEAMCFQFACFIISNCSTTLGNKANFSCAITVTIANMNLIKGLQAHGQYL